MRTSWPITLLLATVGIFAAGLLALLADHLRPHPEDMVRLHAQLSAMDLHANSITRVRAVWRLHYQRSAWSLSRFARFYRVDAETAEGGRRQLYAAFDPWQAGEGMKIL